MASPRAASTLVPYNVTLMPFSPIFDYGAIRDMDVTQVLSAAGRPPGAKLMRSQGWNASYTNDVYTSAFDNQLPAGIAYRRTQAAGAHITFTFQGTGVYLCFSTGGADFTLTLDGAALKTTTSSANQPVCEHAGSQADTLLYASGLRYDTHTVKLDVSASAEREFRFFGGALEIGVQTGGMTVDDSLIVDDQDPQWKYTPARNVSGGWASSPVNRAHLLTGTYTCGYDSSYYAEYTFSGAGGIILSAVVWPVGHAASVQLDDAEPVNLSLTSIWWDGSVPFFIAGGLDPGKEYTLTVRNYNSNVPDCDSKQVLQHCCTSIDAVQLLRAGKEDLNPDLPQDPPQDPGDSHRQPQGPEPDSTKSNTPAIAGGAVGATVGIVVISVTLFFLLRCHRRSRRNEQSAQSAFTAWPSVSRDRPALLEKVSETGSNDIIRPYTATGGSSVVATIGPVVATGDRKQRNGSGPAYHSVYSESRGQETARQSLAPSAAGPSAGSTSSPGLGAEDLERVLAFVAQRMDSGQRAPEGSGHKPEELPQYRG